MKLIKQLIAHLFPNWKLVKIAQQVSTLMDGDKVVKENVFICNVELWYSGRRNQYKVEISNCVDMSGYTTKSPKHMPQYQDWLKWAVEQNAKRLTKPGEPAPQPHARPTDS